MNDNEVYRPPAANLVSITEKEPLNAATKIVLIFIAVQVGGAASNTLNALEFVRVAEASVLSLLTYVLSVALLAIGGLTLAFRSKASVYVLAVAAMFAIMAARQWLPLFRGWPNVTMWIGLQDSPSELWRWQPILLIGGVVLSAAGSVIGFRQAKQQSSRDNASVIV